LARYRLRIRPEASDEIRGAAGWYEGQRPGLGRDFLRAFRAAIDPLRANPLLYQAVAEDARRVLLGRFPFAVFYEVHGPEVVILACIHQARDPEEWERRITRSGLP
jgi:plasmid stabilization system protein ParE